MTAADLSAVILLGLVVLTAYCMCWCFNHFACPRNPQEAAFDDAAQVLRRANRDCEQRDRLRLVKE